MSFRTCGNNSCKECHYFDHERAIIGTWIIEEVTKAIEMGYQILEGFVIWEYDTVQFNEENDRFFPKMINKFIKIKQESDEQKQQYLQDFLRREDLELEFSKIVDNPGLRRWQNLCSTHFGESFTKEKIKVRLLL